MSMRKSLNVVLLICVLSFMMIACGQDDAPGSIPQVSDLIGESSMPATQNTDPTGVPSEPSENLPTEPSEPSEPSEPEGEEVTFKEVDETVRVIKDGKLYQEPNEDSLKRGVIAVGETYKRTGVYSNGWSRLYLQGRTFYVLSDCLTTASTNQTNTSNKEPSKPDTSDDSDDTYAGPTIIQNSDGSATLDFSTTVNPFFAGGKVTISPEHNHYIDGVQHCSVCGRPIGDGSNGTCLRRLMTEFTCEHCGLTFPPSACHTCDDAA